MALHPKRGRRAVSRHLLAFLSGALFGAGLMISGMTQPAKVVGFLDFFGNWDPSLAFVMGGAVLSYFPLSRLILRRKKPLFDVRYLIPTRRDIDLPLVLGSVLFGTGWGLAGYCPGPALTASGAASKGALIFTLAMLGGMAIHNGARRWLRKPERSTAKVAATDG